MSDQSSHTQLYKLLETRFQLLIFIAGIVVLLVSASNELVIMGNGIKIDASSRRILQVSSAIIISYSFYLISRVKSERAKPKAMTSAIQPTDNMQLLMMHSSQNLQGIENRFNELLNNEDLSSHVRRQLYSILNEIRELDGKFGNAAARGQALLVVHGWIDARIPKWKKSLKKREYPGINIIEFRRFKKDIENLLYVLKANINSGVNDSPECFDFWKPTAIDRSLYRKAMIQIRSWMEDEVEETPEDVFGEEEQRLLFTYMNALIKGL